MLTQTQLVSRLGETDQTYLENNSPELALERGSIRLDLIKHSRIKQEQLYFLHEAIVIFETARVEFEEMPLSLYLNLSLMLAKSYQIYYELTQEKRFALIMQQILKPLAHHNQSEVFYLLAYSASIQNQIAMAQHWLTKFAKHNDADHNLIYTQTVFQNFRALAWFKTLFSPTLS